MRMLPVAFRWTEDGVMVPAPNYMLVCRRQFIVGEEYPLQVVEHRSRKSHNQYFAALNEGFDNLPENIEYHTVDGVKRLKKWQDAEHFRAWALVETSFYHETQTQWDTQADARKHATYIRSEKPLARIWVTKDNLVIARDPDSQDYSAMQRDKFEASKKAVLDLLAHLLDVNTRDLKKAKSA